VFVVGNVWGGWDPKKGQKLKWSEGHVWKKTFDVPVGKDIEFKVRCGFQRASMSAHLGPSETIYALLW